MHALTMLHRIFSSRCPAMHAKRLTSLLAAVEAAISGFKLTLSDLGRGLRGKVAVKHNIKRMDRLLGNTLLHAEMHALYGALAGEYLAGVSTPLIVVDWSDLTTVLSPQPQECAYPARPLAFGGLARIGSFKRPGRHRHLRPTDANRGKFPRSQERTLRSGILRQSLHTKGAISGSVARCQLGLICLATDW